MILSASPHTEARHRASRGSRQEPQRMNFNCPSHAGRVLVQGMTVGGYNHGKAILMPFSTSPDRLRELQSEIEDFLKSLDHPVVFEEEVEVFDLTSGRWKLDVEFGKLLFEAWNQARSIGRRVEEVAYRDRKRMGVFVRKPGGRETATLEFRELGSREEAARTARVGSRASFRRELLALLGREYPGWKFERVSNRSDREHSFSTWYARGMARRGRTAWAFLGMAETEPPAAADAVLAYGLIWLEWLRAQHPEIAVSGLRLFLSPSAVDLTAHRATCLRPHTANVEIFARIAEESKPAPVDLKDFGNVETRLSPCRQGPMLVERHRALLGELLGDLFDRVDVAADPSGNFVSLRVHGLEVARVEGQLAARIYFGLEGSYRPLDESSPAKFREFVSRVVEVRRARSQDPTHEFYTLQAERWLESVLLRDITKIDPSLTPACVYPQVPAFAGMDRGVIDILSVTRGGRLTVIELKLQENINLPMQGLDYWLRVKWLSERGQFQERGYFPGLEPTKAPPLLFLVCPAFRFHSTTDCVLRYFDPSIEVVQVGLNAQWREGVRVLFRREMRVAH